jgi:small multidrug resistance pump
MKIQWLYLALAICSEVVATSFLKTSDGFSRLGPSLIVMVGYGVSFYFLSLTLKAIPLGIAYAVWSGVGLVLISIVGSLYHHQHLDMPAVAGIGLIMVGVLVINLYSKSVAH